MICLDSDLSVAERQTVFESEDTTEELSSNQTDAAKTLDRDNESLSQQIETSTSESSRRFAFLVAKAAIMINI